MTRVLVRQALTFLLASTLFSSGIWGFLALGVLVALELELGALHLMSRCFTTWALPLDLLTLVIFWIGSHYFLGLALDWKLPTYASSRAGVTDVHHLTQLICCDGVLLTFCSGRPWSMILSIVTSLVAGITGVRHCTQPSSRVLLMGSFSEEDVTFTHTKVWLDNIWVYCLDEESYIFNKT